jgi:hypothetical protein
MYKEWEATLLYSWTERNTAMAFRLLLYTVCAYCDALRRNVQGEADKDMR